MHSKCAPANNNGTPDEKLWLYFGPHLHGTNWNIAQHVGGMEDSKFQECCLSYICFIYLLRCSYTGRKYYGFALETITLMILCRLVLPTDVATHIAEFLNFPPNLNVEYLVNLASYTVFRQQR